MAQFASNRAPETPRHREMGAKRRVTICARKEPVCQVWNRCKVRRGGGGGGGGDNREAHIGRQTSPMLGFVLRPKSADGRVCIWPHNSGPHELSACCTRILAL